PLLALARDRPVGQRRMAQAVERELLAFVIVGEELLAVAPGGDEVVAQLRSAVLGRRDAQERLALFRPADEQREELAQGGLDGNLPPAGARLGLGELAPLPLPPDVDDSVREVDRRRGQAPELADAQPRVPRDRVQDAPIGRHLLARSAEQGEQLTRVERRHVAVRGRHRRLHASRRVVAPYAQALDLARRRLTEARGALTPDVPRRLRREPGLAALARLGRLRGVEARALADLLVEPTHDSAQVVGPDAAHRHRPDDGGEPVEEALLAVLRRDLRLPAVLAPHLAPLGGLVVAVEPLVDRLERLRGHVAAGDCRLG